MIKQPAIDFVLPGDWWHIPVADLTSRTAAIRKIAEASVGRQDDRAKLRADLRARLGEAASLAEKVGGHDLYYLRQLRPGASAPLSLTIGWPEIPLAPSRLATGTVAAESFLQTLNATTRKGEAAVVDANPRYGVVREVQLTGDPELLPSRVEEIANLTVTYWLFNPESIATLLMTFTTALAKHREAVIALTDTIVASVNWRSQGDRARIQMLPIG